LKSDFNDAFDVAGDGFGRTFSFDFFPLRIDFILADKSLKIVDFHTYDIHYSDHFPISTTLELE
jgi:endonuclease/exonuclease/phosphatase family metal-dependent hydrolase